MANVLGENETFVIFWGRHETRDCRRQCFNINPHFPRGRIDAEPRVVTFWPESRLLKRRWPNEVLLSSCFPPVGVWVRRSATCPGPQLCGLFKPTIGPWCDPFYTSIHVTLRVFTLEPLLWCSGCVECWACCWLPCVNKENSVRDTLKG